MFRFDETDPELLVIYTGPEHGEVSDFQEVLRRIEARREAGPRFGIILVYEPHEHHADEDHDHEDEAETAYVKLLNDLRHLHRSWLRLRCVGYAAVWQVIHQPAANDLAAWEKIRFETNRFTRYTFGVSGNTFASEAEARDWLHAQTKLPPLEFDEPNEQEAQAQRVGLFYGSTTGMTEAVAEEIAKAWHAVGLPSLAVVNITELETPTALFTYDYLILGASTWNIGQLQDDWEILLPQLATLDFTGRQIALFGVGDQQYYDENFIDAVGMIAAILRERGATLAGQWPTDGYSFTTSRALEDGKFLGLAIDEINQPELSADRIAAWIAQLSGEWQLQASLSASNA